MNTIHDLRGTLAEHAEIHDVEIGTRASAVAHRVRVVRRRRATGVAAAAAVAVVAASVGLASLGGGRLEAPVATLLGMEVPATQISTGYTYDYASGATAPAGGHVAEVTVDPKGTPVLVSWATEGADQHVHVTAKWQDFTSGRPDFTDFVVIPPGAGSTTVSVQGSGRTALAVYRLGARPPAGVTTDGITFRQEVPGRQLVAARIGEPGAVELTLDATVPAGSTRLAFAELCTATAGTMKPDGEAWLAITVDGKPAGGRGCREESTFDPGSTAWSAPETTYRSGQQVRIGLRLLDREHGHLLRDGSARIGYAAYAVTTPDRTFPGGLSLPEVTESQGHTWHLVDAGTGVAIPGQRWTMPVPPSSERQMTVYTVTGFSGAATAWPLVDGKRDSGLGVGRGVTGAVTTEGGLVGPGSHTVGLEVTGATSARAAIGIYELAD